MYFLTINAGTIGVSAVLVLIVGLVIAKMIKDKKSGKGSCSCGGSCSGCGMAGSCHNAASGSDKTGTVPVEDREVVKHITLKIDGMMCGMCEAHICDTIRKAFPDAKKVKASGAKGEAIFLTGGPVDREKLEKAITETGYVFISVTSERYRKNRLFG